METRETAPAGQQIQRATGGSAVEPTTDQFAAALEKYLSVVSADSRRQYRPSSVPRTPPPVTVGDVMTKSLVCAYSSACFKEIAHALHRNGINTVPVLDEDRHVVGVVTASDLLARVGHIRPLPHASHRSRSDKRHKVHADTARELMTSPAITITPGASIAEAARRLTRHRIRSMPVVNRAGFLLGMVSRADLIELFLRSDDDIRHDVQRDVVRKSTEPGHSNVHVSVVEGVVALSGRVSTALIARRLAYRTAEVPGVVDVQDELEWDANDLFVPARH